MLAACHFLTCHLYKQVCAHPPLCHSQHQCQHHKSYPILITVLQRIAILQAYQCQFTRSLISGK